MAHFLLFYFVLLLFPFGIEFWSFLTLFIVCDYSEDVGSVLVEKLLDVDEILVFMEKKLSFEKDVKNVGR